MLANRAASGGADTKSKPIRAEVRSMIREETRTTILLIARRAADEKADRLNWAMLDLSQLLKIVKGYKCTALFLLSSLVRRHCIGLEIQSR
jgi:hypothetical protein